MQANIQYNFSTKLWQHSSPGGWFFVTLPTEMSKEIRENLSFQEEGWGRMKARARIGENEWESAIWFDTKASAYLLPVKAQIRKLGNLEANQEVDVTIWL